MTTFPVMRMQALWEFVNLKLAIFWPMRPEDLAGGLGALVASAAILPSRARDIGMYVGTCRGRRSGFRPGNHKFLNPWDRNSGARSAP